MKILNDTQIELIQTNNLTPYHGNPRHIQAAIEPLKSSINQFGFRNPIIIDSENVVVCGHTRLEAAKQLGIDTLPCIRVVDLSDKEIQAFRLVDNKTAEYSDWDYSKLAAELDAITEIDLSGFNFPNLEDMHSVFEPCTVSDDDFIKNDLTSTAAPETPGNRESVTCPHCGESFEL